MCIDSKRKTNSNKVMKANEMPKRIYIFDYNDAMVTPLEGDTVYVREDAFIKKAIKYLYDYNQNMVKKYGAKAVLGCSEFTINVDEFRKYMEE